MENSTREGDMGGELCVEVPAEKTGIFKLKQYLSCYSTRMHSIEAPPILF